MKLVGYALVVMLFFIAALVGYYVMFIIVLIAAAFVLAKVAIIGQSEYEKAQE